MKLGDLWRVDMPTTLRMLFILCLATTMTLIIACQGSTKISEGDDDNDAVSGCKKDSDCEGSKHCIDETCQYTCETDTDCDFGWRCYNYECIPLPDGDFSNVNTDGDSSDGDVPDGDTNSCTEDQTMCLSENLATCIDGTWFYQNCEDYCQQTFGCGSVGCGEKQNEQGEPIDACLCSNSVDGDEDYDILETDWEIYESDYDSAEGDRENSWTCLNDTDCQDNNPCTADTCELLSGTCSNDPDNNGDACDDQDPYTYATICSAGECIGQNCPENMANCEGSQTECATDLNNDALNCGSCGKTCPTDASNTLAVCHNATCDLICLPGWIDVNEDLNEAGAGNGCEEQCVVTDPMDPPDLEGIDANCDGVDGLYSSAVYVSLQGASDGAGTRQSPLDSIQAGIDMANASLSDDDLSNNKPHVYIAAGDYHETVHMKNGVSVFGGFADDTSWTFDPISYTTAILADTVDPLSGQVVGVLADTLTDRSELQFVTIQTSDDSLGDGVGSFGIWASLSPGLRVANCTIATANGTDGHVGETGQQGLGGLVGGNGGAGSIDNENAEGSGGSGGNSRSCTVGESGQGGSGGDGGSNPAFGGCNGQTGAENTGCGGSSCGQGGQGGTVYSNCSSGGDGFDGGIGQSGQTGEPGLGAISNALVVDYFLWSGAPGQTGHSGESGAGGGGGGGGAGQTGYLCVDGAGSGGGGGGSGGCGGTGGHGGQAGGSSIGILLFRSSGTEISNCVIETGNGGRGGDGGSGGNGGSGGGGGDGGSTSSNEVGEGGDGGDGGKGGNGGQGGGGSGGWSFPIFLCGTDATLNENDLQPGTAGVGGNADAPGTQQGESGNAGTIHDGELITGCSDR